MARPMGDEELVDFLDGRANHTAKLATTRTDGRPHVAPVWFVLDRSTAAPGNPIGDLVFTTGTTTVKGTRPAPGPSGVPVCRRRTATVLIRRHRRDRHV